MKNSSKIPQANNVKGEREIYAFTVFDLQLLYINSASDLEGVFYGETGKDEIDKQFSILRRADLQAKLTRMPIYQKSQNNSAGTTFTSTSSPTKTSALEESTTLMVNHVDASIANL